MKKFLLVCLQLKKFLLVCLQLKKVRHSCNEFVEAFTLETSLHQYMRHYSLDLESTYSSPIPISPFAQLVGPMFMESINQFQANKFVSFTPNETTERIQSSFESVQSKMASPDRRLHLDDLGSVAIIIDFLQDMDVFMTPMLIQSLEDVVNSEVVKVHVFVIWFDF